MSINKDWRSIRYEEKYNWNEVPRPVVPIPIELRRWILFPEDVCAHKVDLHTRMFSDNSAATLKVINNRLEAIRVKLEFWGLHRSSNLLVYCFKPIEKTSKVKVKNPWYNFILVWSLGDYPPDWWFHKCLWCARLSEEYYAQRGIYMNMRKRSQRWRAKQQGKLKQKPLTLSKSLDGRSYQRKT